jgi:hypothetical protein
MLVLTAPLAACGAAARPDIVGTWENDDFIVGFRDDGTMYEMQYIGGTAMEYTARYEFTDSSHIRITPKIAEAPIQGLFGVKIRGSVLVLTSERGGTITLEVR